VAQERHEAGMTILNRVLNAAAGRQDVLLIIFLAMIIFMIVIPLPTWLIDVTITMNFMLAILILMVGLYLPSAAEFTTLPAIILMTTLFRLAISISTTRLILLEADAGKIVETFGRFVAGGSLIVGVIIFLIITIIQFIVITKGAERVAEVGARFSLDAMPGKQMAIDSDVRTGELDLKGARDSRSKLQTESQFYGAMDGTMKFVKGDSIAGIVIILVNMVGGMAMGIINDGMSAGEAARLYTILTIGDGLVSQIPALIIAIGAGSIVTRVSNSQTSDLGKEIVAQLGRNSNSLRFTGGLLIGFALIPGFPKIPFIIAGLGTIGCSFMIERKLRAEGQQGSIEKQLEIEEQLQSSPIQLHVAKELFENFDKEAFDLAVATERKVLLASLGVVFPHYAARRLDTTDPVVELKIEGVGIFRHHIPPGSVAALDTQDNVATFVDAGLQDIEVWESNGSACWVPSEHKDTLVENGIPVLTMEQALARAVSYILPKNITYFLGVQETRLLLNKANRNYPDLVEEVLEHVKLSVLSEILQDLVRESVSIRDFRSVLEGVVKWAPKEKDREVLTEYVRSYLAPQISASVSTDLRTIYGFIFSPELEDVVRASVRATNVGTYLALPVEKRDKLLKSLRTSIKELKGHEGSPTLITAMDNRRVLRTFLWTNGIYLPILSQQDIASDFRVQLLGEIRE
jgi:type III secretion protein V